MFRHKLKLFFIFFLSFQVEFIFPQTNNTFSNDLDEFERLVLFRAEEFDNHFFSSEVLAFDSSEIEIEIDIEYLSKQRELILTENHLEDVKSELFSNCELFRQTMLPPELEMNSIRECVKFEGGTFIKYSNLVLREDTLFGIYEQQINRTSNIIRKLIYQVEKGEIKIQSTEIVYAVYS